MYIYIFHIAFHITNATYIYIYMYSSTHVCSFSEVDLETKTHNKTITIYFSIYTLQYILLILKYIIYVRNTKCFLYNIPYTPHHILYKI